VPGLEADLRMEVKRQKLSGLLVLSRGRHSDLTMPFRACGIGRRRSAAPVCTSPLPSR
jgi:hypothetical protein